MSKANTTNKLLKSRIQFIKDHFTSLSPSDDSFTSNFINSLNPIEQFYIIYHYKLKGKLGYDIACLLIDNPLCDKATASRVFWEFHPERYLFTPDKVPSGKKKHFELLQKIIHKFNKNEFKQQIEYDPKFYFDKDAIKKIKKSKLENWKLPPELTKKPVEGLPVALVNDVNKILKSRAKLIEKHFEFPPPDDDSFTPNYALVQSLNSIEQFYLLCIYDHFNYGVEIPYSIIDSPLCDKATAACIFWEFHPEDYLFAPDNVPDGYKKEFYEFFQKIIRKFKNNEFKYQQIQYDPSGEGYEKVKKCKLENWKLPPELAEPIEGQPVVVVDDKYTPSKKELIEKHFFEYAQEDEDSLDFEFFKSLSSKDQYFCADIFNWDSGILVLQWIIDSPKCDKGTAALIFWRGNPEYYKDFTLDTVENYNKDLFKLLQKIISKFKNNEFKHDKIKFNPQKEGYQTEWETELDIWKLPEDLK